MTDQIREAMSMAGFDEMFLEALTKDYCYLCGKASSDTKRFRLVDSKSGAEVDVKICKDCINGSRRRAER